MIMYWGISQNPTGEISEQPGFFEINIQKISKIFCYQNFIFSLFVGNSGHARDLLLEEA